MDEVREVNGERNVNIEYNETIVEMLESIKNQLFELEDCLNNSNDQEQARAIRIYVEQQILGYETLYGVRDNGIMIDERKR